MLRRILENVIHTVVPGEWNFLDRDIENQWEKDVTWESILSTSPFLFLTHLVSRLPGQEDEVRNGAHEDEHAVKGERDEEEIKISIVPLADTVTHPRAVMVEPEKYSREIHK